LTTRRISNQVILGG